MAQTIDIEAAAEALWNECQACRWGITRTTEGKTYAEFKADDPIGASEFEGIAERVLRAALKD